MVRTYYGGYVLYQDVDDKCIHTSILFTYSPRHLLARVSLAKRPRPMSSKTHCTFLDPTLFSPPPRSLSPKKKHRDIQKIQIHHHDRAALPTPITQLPPPTRSPMPKLISHRRHPPLPCAPTKHRSQICSVDRLGSPKTRDHRSRG
jgi:hypothetical protein